MQIAVISDIALGYSTPQIPSFTRSLCRHYDTRAVVYEPGLPERPPKHEQFAVYPIEIRRRAGQLHPYTHPGRDQYADVVAAELNASRPETVVICCSYVLPVLLRLNYRPRQVLYYSLESIGHYWQPDIEVSKQASRMGLIDLPIFPGRNRLIADSTRCGFDGIPKLVLYNCSEGDFKPLPADKRNGRIIYAGAIDPRTCGNLILDKAYEELIDIYGFTTDQTTPDMQRRLNEHPGFRGHIAHDELISLMPQYAYSLVIWNPDTENQKYAAPNKMFESIACGVPPICAPHPQCREVIERWGCGYLADEWTLDAFRPLIEMSTELLGMRPEYYQRRVNACAVAVAEELTWEKQFAKVVPYLKEG